VLIELADALVEGVDVGGCAEPGFTPGVFTERFRQPLLQLLNTRAEPGGSLAGGEQIRLQRAAYDRWAGVLVGDWICLQRMDFLQQVGVPVEECAVDRGTGNGGHRRAGFLRVRPRLSARLYAQDQRVVTEND
jgi:hypothetical protein